jgi:hypothetical protein
MWNVQPLNGHRFLRIQSSVLTMRFGSPRMKLVDWTDELLNITDTAAPIENLDLVMTSIRRTHLLAHWANLCPMLRAGDGSSIEMIRFGVSDDATIPQAKPGDWKRSVGRRHLEKFRL